MEHSDKTYMVRPEGTLKDLHTLYGVDNNIFFTVEIHHGGRFANSPGRIYEEGKVILVDFVDLDAFNIKYIDDLVEDIIGTKMNLLSTCKRGESMDYGLRCLCFEKEATIFKETVIEEGLHIKHIIYIEFLEPSYSFHEYYPYAYKRATPEEIAHIIRPYVMEIPGRLFHDYNDLFEWLHGIRLDPILMDKAGKIAMDYQIAWGSGDAYILKNLHDECFWEYGFRALNCLFSVLRL